MGHTGLERRKLKLKQLCSARSSRVSGTPYFSRYSGEATILRRAIPILLARRVESVNTPTRNATSVRSRYMSTISSLKDRLIWMFGWASQKAGKLGSIAIVPNATEALMRTVPRAFCAPWANTLSTSSSSASKALLRS
ncbi:hypothetical protein D3C85_1138830 [compost metagenome]